MPTHQLLSVFAFSCFAITVTISGYGQTGEARNIPPLKAAPKVQPDRPGLETPDRPRVTVIDGRLSASIVNKSVRALLEEISQQSGIYVSTEEVKDSLVSVEFRKFHWRSGFRRS
jgi:hypothetical protein